MALTLSGVRNAVAGASDVPDERLGQLLDVASDLCTSYTTAAPTSIMDEAKIRLVSYLIDRESGAIKRLSAAGLTVSYSYDHSQMFRVSGAQAMLSRWKTRYAGLAVTDESAEAATDRETTTMSTYQLFGAARADASFRGMDFHDPSTSDGQYVFLEYASSATPKFIGYAVPVGEPEPSEGWLSSDGGFGEVSGQGWSDVFRRGAVQQLAGGPGRTWRSAWAVDLTDGLILRLQIPETRRGS